ncbi:MAG: UDP-N-acetylmuramate--L-alanine ligase [Clostridiales bacterium]|nr:UDP-N-acetylmuramate--L-alanine ligase [Clostridiales bacterium]
MSEEINYGQYPAIHFVGIGGVSMSALAEIMRLRGHAVSGSDLVESSATEQLRAAGVRVDIGHRAQQVEGADLVVYTAAVARDNPELAAARAAGIPLMERAPFLGGILQLYGYPIGVSGTHGKTTTTSMISQILLETGADPTVLIGGTLPLIGHNYRIGQSPYIVYEACEYVDSFLHFRSRITVILNIDCDHLDYFSGIAQIRDSFARFADLTLPGGCVVANADDEQVRLALAGHRGEVLTFSVEDPGADVYGRLLEEGPLTAFEVFEAGVSVGVCRLRVPGLHNVKNALAAIAACRRAGVAFEDLRAPLEGFSGVKRRFEHRGTWPGARVVDDYAHHPTEIAATLRAAQNMGYGRVFCVFQPHTYSRTKALLDDFAAALSLADRVLLTDIYAAREAPDPTIGSEQLAARIENARYCGDMARAMSLLKEELRPDDLLITMGAGDIYKLGETLLKEP